MLQHLSARRRPAHRRTPNKTRQKSTIIHKLRNKLHHLVLSDDVKIIPLIVIPTFLLICILIYLQFPHSHDIPPHWVVIPDHTSKSDWISFGAYVGRPHYYIKKGALDSSIANNKEQIRKLVSVTTFCDINLLHSAQQIAHNYLSGPLSLSVFIDADYRQHTDNPKLYYKILNNTFQNVSNTYDIIIGLLYVNKSNQFYINKGFSDTTPLVFRFPMNPLRNLAEYQVWTEWTFNIDIDFWYLSQTLNQNIQRYINEMRMYAYKSVFIVPSFEVIDQNNEMYTSLNKSELINIVLDKNEMKPFHFPQTDPQMCTDYNVWYGSDTNYRINYMSHNCSLYYEPWYIIRTNLSRKYEWNNRFIGRGYSKTSRVVALRHECFEFVVMKDLFIIHAAQEIHVTLNQTLRNKWTGRNRHLLIKDIRNYYKQRKSCLMKPLHIQLIFYIRSILFGPAQFAYDAVMDWYCNQC